MNVRSLISKEETNLSKEWTSIYFPNNFLGQNLLWRDLGWPTNQQTCVLVPTVGKCSGPEIFVLVKVGPITIGQLIRYIGSQKHSIKQICFFIAQQKEDQIWLWVLLWSLESGPIEEKNWSHPILLSRIGMNSIDLSIIWVSKQW